MLFMRKTFQFLGLNGAIIWGAAILIRSMNLSMPAALQLIVGVAPNFGVVWLLMGLYVASSPALFKRESTRKGRYLVIAVIPCVLLLSEAVHAAFLGARFDTADIIASMIALIPLIALNASIRQPT